MNPKGVSILDDVAACDSFSDSSFLFSEKRRKTSEKMMHNGHVSYVALGNRSLACFPLELFKLKLIFVHTPLE